MTWFLDLRADGVGGTPAKQVMLRQGMGYYPNLQEFLLQIRGRDVLIGTHGFNVDRTDGVLALSDWEKLLDLGDNALFVGVLWPGDTRWIPVLDYPFEDTEAIDSATLLAEYLDLYFSDATSLSFVSHSLGARMVLETISKLKRETVAHVTLMAGAISSDCLATAYRATVPRIESLAVLASHCDHVLELAFPVGNPAAGLITQGSPYHGGALGRYGPQPPLPSNLRTPWHIPDAWKCDHGDYVGGNETQYPTPTNLPAPDTPVPHTLAAWTAAFVSTQFRKAVGH
ncbi:alpha/beta hydrolase [Pseudomonas sp.]|uniref:alpha/beta hydrolase n=1 Tax=Pseudomonas sp. TaxID=306 RepID=UPI001B02D09F|nr:alpha/beta hydrolase [Pseudomonas sp.]MBO9548075.1 alpha/beta hydrolase [Pseudomonas sp.]